MSESSASIEILASQGQHSLAKTKSETTIQTKPQLEELISYLDTREDIAEVSTPSGGLVRVKNKDGLYNYYGTDKKLISENWFIDAKDFNELVPESNKFVAMVGKKTEETGINAGIDYFFIDTQGEIAELSNAKTLPNKPIFHLPDIDEGEILHHTEIQSPGYDEELLTDQEKEIKKMIAETKENFKNSGIVEFMEYLRNNYFLAIGGDSLVYGKNYGNEKKFQKKVNRISTQTKPSVIGYYGTAISIFYNRFSQYFSQDTNPLKYPDHYDSLTVEKNPLGYTLKSIPKGSSRVNSEITTITSSDPEIIISGIIKLANLGTIKQKEQLL